MQGIPTDPEPMTVTRLTTQIGIPQLNVEIRDITGNSLYHGKAGNVVEPIRDYPVRRVCLVIEVEKFDRK